MFRNPMTSLALSIGLLLSGAIVVGSEGGKDDAAAIAKQTEGYPLKTCVVTGEELGSMGKPYDMLYEGRLVRFCCKGCVKKFNAEPAKYMKQIDDASAKDAEKAQGEAAPKAAGCGGCGKQEGCGACGGAEKAARDFGEAAPKAKSGGCGSGCGGCGAR